MNQVQMRMNFDVKLNQRKFINSLRYFSFIDLWCCFALHYWRTLCVSLCVCVFVFASKLGMHMFNYDLGYHLNTSRNWLCVCQLSRIDNLLLPKLLGQTGARMVLLARRQNTDSELFSLKITCFQLNQSNQKNCVQIHPILIDIA